MKRTRYDLFQFDPTTCERFPYYERAYGYTKTECENEIKRCRKVGVYLTKRINKEVSA